MAALPERNNSVFCPQFSVHNIGRELCQNLLLTQEVEIIGKSNKSIVSRLITEGFFYIILLFRMVLFHLRKNKFD